MTPSQLPAAPLVSVIIPCYNHGKYLSKAVGSVLAQSHRPIEIIVVDDGSIDDTRAAAAQYPEVKYIYQHNQGPSAARNTGIDHSSGDYLVFLDADDWLFEDALHTNLEYLMQNPHAGFVSGAYTLAEKGSNDEVIKEITRDHYLHLLQRNYIAMHATVMYRREALAQFRFDATLRGCEDYDVYLQIARRFPVIHHTKQIAVYTIHSTNSSENLPLMLDGALRALDRQKDQLVSREEKESYRMGRAYWIRYYCSNLYTFLTASPLYKSGRRREEGLAMLKKYDKNLYRKYQILRPIMRIKKSTIKHSGNFFLRWLYRAGIYRNFIPSTGKVIKGDFNRTSPFSKAFGYDRGGPLDRYYIENFLAKHADAVKGSVLEIGDNAYTVRYGGARVTRSEVLHIQEGHPQATIYGDLANLPQVPDNYFDCIILTQTLQVIYHYTEALQTCFRTLKPGGTLLLTTTGLGQIDQGEWKESWYWSFTKNSITKLLSGIFPVPSVDVHTFGNVLVASAYLFGMGLKDISKQQMDFSDPHYQVIITAVAVKPDA